MIPTTNSQPNALVPINRPSVESGITLADRFTDSSVAIYSKFSPYDASGGGFSLGYQQPYVWTGLNDSRVKKYLKKYDNTTFPVGSSIQDTQRLTKFMASGTGLVFSAIQFSIQNQNAFNETRIWNPASIVTSGGISSLARLFGAQDKYPMRHIESSGGGFFATIGDGLLSSVGIKTKAILDKVAPPGTAKLGLEALSIESKSGAGWAAKGLTRYQTSVAGRDHFMAKFVSNGTNAQGQSVFSTFLKSLGNSIISKVTSLIPSTKSKEADWKYRVEYSDKVKAYHAFYEDRSGLLSYNINGQIYTTEHVHRFYPSTDDRDTKDNWYYGPTQSSNGNFSSPIEKLTDTLKTQNFDPSVDVHGKTLGKPSNINSTVTKKTVDEALGDSTVNRINSAVIKWNTIQKANKDYDAISSELFKGAYKTYKDIRDTIGANYENSIIDKTKVLDSGDGKDMAGSMKSDGYNQYKPIKSKNIPKQLLDRTENTSRDIIFFYFYDVVNEVYIPFRATMTGMSENTSVEWEDFQYIGRADKLYMYKGFSREIYFTFSVYASSVSDLEPMWNRINYLSGLTRPAKYTEGKAEGGLGEFMYPPMLKFRIGDLFVDQPAVIRNFGVNVPDDSPWETLRATIYSYNNGKISSTRNVAQLPMKVDITVSMALIEKERSQTDALRYFDDTLKGFNESGAKQYTQYRNERRLRENAKAVENAKIATSDFSPGGKYFGEDVLAPRGPSTLDQTSF